MVFHQLFIENVKKNPKALAVVEQSTEKVVTFENLLIAALVFKDIFLQYNSKFIGIMIPPSTGCIIALLASFFADKTPVMINYSTGASENSVIAQKKCNFKHIITSKLLLEKLNIAPVKGMVFMEDLAKDIGLLQKIKAKLVSKLPVNSLKKMVAKGDRDENIVVLFTSGSEKDPKAVQLTHKNILANVYSLKELLTLSHNDVFITNLPYFHIFGLTVNFFIPLVLGSKIVTTPNPLDYKVITDTIRKYQVTVFTATPTFYHGYYQKARVGDFNSIRYMVSGADKLPQQIREEYLKTHKKEILEGYGATETSPVITLNTPWDVKIGSVGKPIPGVQVMVTSLETGEELPRGSEGKILVKGDLVMKGYLNDLEQTRMRLKEGWYDTGDMGIYDEEGFVHHRGRLKRFVKIGGEMVSLVKVEDEINNILPDNIICCVVDIPDTIKGSEIVAVVTTREINQKELKKKLAKVLPTIAIPKQFCVIDELPMSSSGKVNFRQVEEICRNDKLEKF